MIFGWDVSTAVIGCAMFDDDCNFASASYCDLRKVDGLNEKADIALEFVHKMINCEESYYNVHFIEDKLSGMGGGSNAGTIMKLAAFNAMVSWMIWGEMEANDKLESLHPSTVKAIMKREGLVVPKGGDKKKLTLEFVKNKEKRFPLVLNKNDNPQPYCYDQADAYITAVAGHRKFVKNGA